MRTSALDRERAPRRTATRHPAGHRLLDLQRSAGNRAVHGLLESADPRIAHALSQAPPEVDAVLGSDVGRPLEPGVRADLEQLVGADLSDVRVHDDAAAAGSAEAADARAYSAGEDIVFGPGRYAPETEEGRGLLAHEVGHVVAGRRSGGGPAPIMRAPKEGVGERLNLLPGVPPPRVSTIGSSTIATIYFARDMWLMEPEGFAVVQRLAEQLSYMAKPFVTVEGYASAEGPANHNDDLARLRREAVVSTLSAKAHDTTFAGRGHGASDPAVPETATDPTELEGQRALNRRVEIVITDLTAPAPTTTPKPGADPARPGGDIFKPIPQKPETPEEEANRRLKEMLKLPPDLGRPKKSANELAWKAIDDGLDSLMSNLGVPRKYRGIVKDGAHAAIEKGAETVLDSALDAAHLSSQQKDAIKSAVKAAAQTKF